jgi:hypothetical protein
MDSRGASKKVALNYLSRLAMEFPERMKLVNEHERLVEQLKHLEKRYNIDKISDSPHALEVKAEIRKAQNRIREILDKLSF